MAGRKIINVGLKLKGFSVKYYEYEVSWLWALRNWLKWRIIKYRYYKKEER
jgi:hypothetical protein